MGKKNRKKNKKGQRIVSANGKPFISVCTPTYNRRKFIPFLIKCFKAQTYPPQLMEWIVVDDGTDPVGDLFQDNRVVLEELLNSKIALNHYVMRLIVIYSLLY